MKLFIARDKDGALFLCKFEPIVKGNIFYGNSRLAYLPTDSFPEVTFENSPQQVEIKLIK